MHSGHAVTVLTEPLRDQLALLVVCRNQTGRDLVISTHRVKSQCQRGFSKCQHSQLDLLGIY